MENSGSSRALHRAGRLLVMAYMIALAATTQAQPAPESGATDVDVWQIVLRDPSTSYDFSPEGVRNYNSGVHDAAVRKFLQNNVPVTSEDVNALTEVMTVAGHKIYKSRLYVPGHLFMFQFAGFVSGNSHGLGVACMSRSATPFETPGTECERRVIEVFGH